MLKKTIQIRKNEGYALISILVIGSFGMMFLLGLATTFLTILRSESVYHEKSMLLDAADAALDYTLESLNKSPPTNNNDVVVWDIPASNFPSVTPAISVKVRVTPLEHAGGIDWTNVNDFSVLQAFPPIPISNAISQTSKSEYWRLVEITATRGLFQKNVRVILEPQIQPPSGSPLPSSSAMNGTTTYSLFPQAVFANNNISLGNSLEISPKSGMSALTVQSSTANLANNANITGNLNAQKVTGSTDVTQAPTVSGDLNTDKVEGEIIHPNDAQPFTIPPSISPTPTNSFANALQLPSGGVTDLASSSYAAKSFQVNSSSAITLPSAPASPTKVYIDSSAGSTTIETNGITYGDGLNANPLNFQIYYDGSDPINIKTTAASPFLGTVYAPRAKVLVTGGGDFKGAVLGNDVSFENSSVEAITDINNANTNTPTGQSNFSYGFVYRTDSNNRLFFQGYKPVTWQEVNEKLVD